MSQAAVAELAGEFRTPRNAFQQAPGSIHNDGPVNPVCPYDPIGNNSPRGAEKPESISQPNPRRIG